MIHLSRLHGAGSIVINADLIETIEACPDTTITLMTKRKFVVADSLDDVVDRIVAYRRRVNAAYLQDAAQADGSPPPPMGAPAKSLSLEEEEAA